jgi:hypothetical protein
MFPSIAPTSTEEGHALAEEVGAVAFFECAVSQSEGVREVFEECVEMLLRLGVAADEKNEDGGRRAKTTTGCLPFLTRQSSSIRNNGLSVDVKALLAVSDEQLEVAPVTSAKQWNAAWLERERRRRRSHACYYGSRQRTEEEKYENLVRKNEKEKAKEEEVEEGGDVQKDEQEEKDQRQTNEAKPNEDKETEKKRKKTGKRERRVAKEKRMQKRERKREKKAGRKAEGLGSAGSTISDAPSPSLSSDHVVSAGSKEHKRKEARLRKKKVEFAVVVEVRVV